MGILPHAEEHEIDHRLAKRLANGKLLQFVGGHLHRLSLAALGQHAMHLAKRNLQWLKQTLVGEFEIALIIGRRHEPFVAPEKMHVIERARTRLLYHQFV